MPPTRKKSAQTRRNMSLAIEVNPAVDRIKLRGFNFPAHRNLRVSEGVESAGLTVNAHLFRHVCAFLYLKAHPGDYETVRLLLGHTSLATTVRAYCGLERSDAVRRYDSLIDTYRRTQGSASHVG
jgi:integrase